MLQEVCLDTRSSPFLQKAKRKKKKKKEKEKSKRPEARRQDVEEQETPVLLDAFRFSPCLYALSQKNKETQEGVFLSQI